MSKLAWHAYYFADSEISSAPVRSELIEADCADEAAQVAKGLMANCKRAEIVTARWERPQHVVICADEEPPESTRIW